MKKIFPLLLVGGVVAAVFFINTAKKLTNLLVQPSDFRLGKIAGGKLPVLLTLDVVNPNAQAVSVKEINGVITSGSTTLCNFKHVLNINVPGHSAKTSIKNMKFELPIATSILTLLVNFLKTSSAGTYTIKGTLYAENMALPFTKTINATISGIGQTSHNTLGVHPGISNIGRITSVDNALKTIFKTPTGKEKSINGTLFYGLTEQPYAYVRELNKAGVSYTNGLNPVFGRLSKMQARKFLEWLESEDGYLNYE